MVEMAKANTHDDDVDALSLFNSDFYALGMSNESDGLHTCAISTSCCSGSACASRAGSNCCGRDQSADNVSVDTCEAGLFQTSYNAHDCHPTFDSKADE